MATYLDALAAFQRAVKPEDFSPEELDKTAEVVTQLTQLGYLTSPEKIAAAALCDMWRSRWVQEQAELALYIRTATEILGDPTIARRSVAMIEQRLQIENPRAWKRDALAQAALGLYVIGQMINFLIPRPIPPPINEAKNELRHTLLR